MDDFIVSGTRYRWDGGDTIPSKPGVYAIYLMTTQKLPKNWQDLLNHKDDILYIGQSGNIGEGNLKTRLRQHYRRTSQSSTFRRSMGAILRKHLNLQVRPRPDRPKYYGFENEGVLSDWIQENCAFKYQEFEKSIVGRKEKFFIDEHAPLLNMDNDSEIIIRLDAVRGECAKLASS